MSNIKKYNQMTAEELWEEYRRLSNNIVAAKAAYAEWASLRVSACKIAGRFHNEDKHEDEAYSPMLSIIEIATRKCEAIEAYLSSQEDRQSVCNNMINAREGYRERIG